MGLLKLIIKFFSKIFLFTGKLESKNSFERRLKPEEEKMYFDRIISAKNVNKTDPEAEEALVKHNLRLVAHISNKYKSNFSDPDDLISVGSIGLIKAVRSFSPEKANSFSTYASKCIENEILMLLRSEKKLNAEVSFDTTIGTDKDGNDMALKDIISDQSEDLNESSYRTLELEKMERAAKNVLDKRELLIISYRYGMFGKLPRTQKEVAKKLNISRSYISRIEKTAINKIKQEMNRKKKLYNM